MSTKKDAPAPEAAQLPATLTQPIIETVEIGRIKPWGKNPRKDHAVDVIAESMKRYGYLVPIVVQKGTYRLLAGHGRLEAMKKGGIERVPVIVADLDDKAADMFTVTDNKATLISQWDFQSLAEILRKASTDLDLSLLGWTDHELEPLLSAEWLPKAEGDLADFQRKKQGNPIQLSKEQRAVFEKAVAAARHKWSKPDETEGAVLASICRDWLKGQK